MGDPAVQSPLKEPVDPTVFDVLEPPVYPFLDGEELDDPSDVRIVDTERVPEMPRLNQDWDWG